MWANWVAAFGVLIELVGFGTLAWDLLKTNKSTIAEIVALKSEKVDANNMIVSEATEPGEVGGISFGDGRISKMLDLMQSREDDLHKQTALIIRGLSISVFGCVLQVVGSFGQAVQSPLPN